MLQSVPSKTKITLIFVHAFSQLFHTHVFCAGTVWAVAAVLWGFQPSYFACSMWWVFVIVRHRNCCTYHPKKKFHTDFQVHVKSLLFHYVFCAGTVLHVAYALWGVQSPYFTHNCTKGSIKSRRIDSGSRSNIKNNFQYFHMIKKTF